MHSKFCWSEVDVCFFFKEKQTSAFGGTLSAETKYVTWTWATCSADNDDLEIYTPNEIAEFTCTAHFKHFADSSYLGGFPKLQCAAGYAYQRTEWPNSFQVKFSCYKCPSCTEVEWQDWKPNDEFQITRQVCKALAECGAGTEGACQGLCKDCPAGKHGPGTTSTTDAVCKSCDAGTYSKIAKQSKCDDCDSGTASETTGLSACKDCPEGKKATSASVCTACAAGEANPLTRQVACFACDPGKYAASTLQINCASCIAGTYQAKAGKSACDNCEAGSYKALEGTHGCSQCLRATYEKDFGSTKCDNCPAGKSSDYGATKCTDCVPGKYAPEATQTRSQNEEKNPPTKPYLPLHTRTRHRRSHRPHPMCKVDEHQRS